LSWRSGQATFCLLQLLSIAPVLPLDCLELLARFRQLTGRALGPLLGLVRCLKMAQRLLALGFLLSGRRQLFNRSFESLPLFVQPLFQRRHLGSQRFDALAQ